MRLIVSILALSALAAGPAMAQNNGNPNRGAMLDRLLASDANHDGAVTRAEMQAGRTALFARLDANHDGAVSADERPAEGGRMIGRADADGDGRVTREEFLNQPYRGFDRLDADHNGVISQAEITAARAALGGT